MFPSLLTKFDAAGGSGRSFWGEQYVDLQAHVGHEPVRGTAEQTANRHALVFPEETYPAQILVRRIGALLDSGLGDAAAQDRGELVWPILDN